MTRGWAISSGRSRARTEKLNRTHEEHADDRTEPMAAPLRECEDERANWKDKASDQGSVQACLGTSFCDVLRIQFLLKIVRREESDKGRDAGGDGSTRKRGRRREQVRTPDKGLREREPGERSAYTTE